MERRLSAIMAADVVGYSRLMGANEVGTLTALNHRRSEVIEPRIATMLPRATVRSTPRSTFRSLNDFSRPSTRIASAVDVVLMPDSMEG